MKQIFELFSCLLVFLKYHLWKPNVYPIAILTRIPFPVFPSACTPCNCLFVQTILVEHCLCLYPCPLLSLLYRMWINLASSTFIFIFLYYSDSLQQSRVKDWIQQAKILLTVPQGWQQRWQNQKSPLRAREKKPMSKLNF